MALFADLDAILRNKGFRLYGLHSLASAPHSDGHLLFGNALYEAA